MFENTDIFGNVTHSSDSNTKAEPKTKKAKTSRKPRQDKSNSQSREHWAAETTVFEGEKKEGTDDNDSYLGGDKSFPPEDFVINNVPNVPNVPTFDLSTATNAGEESIDNAMAVMDAVILGCNEKPSLLFSSEFIDASKIIKAADRGLWVEYRVAIKRAKPSGVLLSDIDDATNINESSGDESETVAAKLIALALSSGSLFFDEKSDKGFLSADINGVIHTLAIGKKPFIDWLSYAYYSTTKQDSRDGNGFSASETAIKQAGFALSGIAKHEGEKQRVHLRVADHNGGHYLFIGDDILQVIEVLPTGWRVIDNAPVKFWQPSSMLSLPQPQHGGDLSKLWDFVNIPEPDRLLVLAWVLEAYREETPKPILALSGLQGSAKSSTQSKLRELIDNNAVNLRAAPKSTEDVFIGAGCNLLSSYENISYLSSKMQDALCTLATGGGFAARTLYTNDEETIIEVKRPVIINSIPRVITAQDLTDRAICIELPSIEYREEAELNTAWQLAKPSIMGGLLDLFVKTLAQLPKVKLNKPPRMADFTRLGEAMAQSLGHSSGTFDALYKANRTESITIALEASPVGLAIREMVDNHKGSSTTVFYGTVKNLYDALSIDHKHNSESWPRSPRGLSEIVKRQSPALQSLGISVTQSTQRERTDTGRGLSIKIFKSGNIGNIGNVVYNKFPLGENLRENSVANFSSDEGRI